MLEFVNLKLIQGANRAQSVLVEKITIVMMIGIVGRATMTGITHTMIDIVRKDHVMKGMTMITTTGTAQGRKNVVAKKAMTNRKNRKRKRKRKNLKKKKSQRSESVAQIRTMTLSKLSHL